MLRKLGALACAAMVLTGCDDSTTREIRVVGSSTVFPFTTAVAEAFVKQDDSRKPPRIESTGTGAGLRRFCEGQGAEFPDVADASRRMTRQEYDLCRKNGVAEVIEVQIGADGIALAEANGGPRLAVSRKDLYLALAANPGDRPNTAKTWREVNPALPAVPILVIGPPATSGTRDAFAELILEPGCLEANPAASALKNASDPAQYHNACRRIREDGAYADSGENDDAIVQALAQNPKALGIFGYSYLEKNRARLHGVSIDGIQPTYDTIVTSKYPGSRPLYLYVKKQHLRAVPGLEDFLKLYISMLDPKGELVARGMVATTANVRNRSYEVIHNAVALDPATLP